LSVTVPNHSRSTDSLALELHGYFHSVSNFDERDSTVHPVLLAVEGHRAIHGNASRSFALDREGQFFRLGDAANRKIAVKNHHIGAGSGRVG
jgi:hypothetical protein